MPIRVSDIKVGNVYRFKGDLGRDLKPRMVISHNTHTSLAGGIVGSHTGMSRNGKQTQTDYMAGEYFAEHAVDDESHH